MLAADGIRLAFRFEPFRGLLHFDEEKETVERTMDKKIFWEELVRDVRENWNAVDVRLSSYCSTVASAVSNDVSPFQKSVKQYKIRSTLMGTLGTRPEFDSGLFHTTAPIYSSIGDFSRLGVLEAFRPESRNLALTVEDVWFSLRRRGACFLHFMYEYDGQLQIALITSGRTAKMENLELYLQIFRELVNEV
jgi:hypothetical protein